VRRGGGSTLLEELCSWASALELADVPERVVALARSQVLSQLSAVRAGMSHPLGLAVQDAFGSPLQSDPARAACALAGLTPWLYFDDTSYAGHLSNSTVTVALAYGLALNLDGSRVLAAVVAANECAARISAAVSLGPVRGQNSPHTHLAGSIAARLHSEHYAEDTWVNALSLAFSQPSWPSLHGFIGSDARVLSALSPVRAGLDACDAGIGGLRGSADVLEDEEGFLARYATVPLPEAVVAGLGTLWHTDTLSFELQPGAPVHDAAVECALELRSQIGPVTAEDIDEIVIATSLYSMLVDHRSSAYLDGPRSTVGGLMFSAGYLVATALMTGGITAADFTTPAMQDPDRWRLARKVRLVQDAQMTRSSFRCEVPFGEALRLAGDRAPGWLAKLGGEDLVQLVGPLAAPSTSFERAEKRRPARVEVHLADGRTLSHEVDIAEGSAGSRTRSEHEALMRRKFLSTGGSKTAADIAEHLDRADPAEVAAMLQDALTCPPGTETDPAGHALRTATSKEPTK
jgi:2-methylcitrate dehydratase PrpD